MEEKIVFTRKLAYELRRLGFPIIRVEPNKHKPELDVYFFDSTAELNEAIDMILRRQALKREFQKKKAEKA